MIPLAASFHRKNLNFTFFQAEGILVHYVEQNPPKSSTILFINN